jgi:hypothetical protein
MNGKVAMQTLETVCGGESWAIWTSSIPLEELPALK